MAGGCASPCRGSEKQQAHPGGQTRWQRKMCTKKARRPPPTPKGRPLIFLREEDEEEVERGGAGAEKQHPDISTLEICRGDIRQEDFTLS